MSGKRSLIFLFLFTLLAVYGCAQEETATDEPAVSVNESESNEQKQETLYENTEVGIKVYETSNWMVEKELTEPLNVTFESGQLKAIITVTSNEKSFNEIKQELKAGAGKVSIIEETDDYLAFQSDRKESIRTDVYLQQKGVHTGIITFMTPLQNYEMNQEKIEAFKRKIELF